MEKPSVNYLTDITDRELLEVMFAKIMQISRQVDRLDSFFHSQYPPNLVNATSLEQDLENAFETDHDHLDQAMHSYLDSGV